MMKLIVMEILLKFRNQLKKKKKKNQMKTNLIYSVLVTNQTNQQRIIRIMQT